MPVTAVSTPKRNKGTNDPLLNCLITIKRVLSLVLLLSVEYSALNFPLFVASPSLFNFIPFSPLYYSYFHNIYS